MTLNFEKAHISWRWDENVIRVYEPEHSRWIDHEFPQGAAEPGYDRSISEDMYIDETNSFINALAGKSAFPNSLDDDIKVLSLLYQFEEQLNPS